MDHHDHMLKIFFNNSSQVALFFYAFDTSNGNIPYSVLCLVCFLMGFIEVTLKCLKTQYEFFYFEKEKIDWESSTRPINQKIRVFPFTLFNFFKTILTVATCAWDHILMLAIMTCNIGIFVSILAGIGLGHFSLGQYLYSYNDGCGSTQTPIMCSSQCKLSPSLSRTCHC
jgi:solute carrier family 31 (copper transporter), member 1